MPTLDKSQHEPSERFEISLNARTQFGTCAAMHKFVGGEGGGGGSGHLHLIFRISERGWAPPLRLLRPPAPGPDPFSSPSLVAVPGAQWRELSRKGGRKKGMFESAKEKREETAERREEGKLWGVRQTMRAFNLMAPPTACKSEGSFRASFSVSCSVQPFQWPQNKQPGPE